LQEKLAAIKKDFSDLNTNVKVESNFYKWVGVSGVFVALVFAAVGILLGALGISQWHDIINKLKSNVEQTSNYQSALARGMALANGRYPQAAIEPLRKCYAETPQDEAVAGTLLWSYEETDRWENAEIIANKMSEDFGIERIKDSWVLNNIGRAFLYEGQSDPAKLALAGKYLERAAENLEGDADERDVLENLWVYYLFKGEIPKAEETLKKAVAVKSSKGPWGREEWQKEMDWSLFRYLAERNKSMNANAKKTITDVIK
jgi:tetratricopeptide (TPR) repeat protein